MEHSVESNETAVKNLLMKLFFHPSCAKSQRDADASPHEVSLSLSRFLSIPPLSLSSRHIILIVTYNTNAWCIMLHKSKGGNLACLFHSTETFRDRSQVDVEITNTGLSIRSSWRAARKCAQISPASRSIKVAVDYVVLLSGNSIESQQYCYSLSCCFVSERFQGKRDFSCKSIFGKHTPRYRSSLCRTDWVLLIFLFVLVKAFANR